jgi:hypothetical protein
MSTKWEKIARANVENDFTAAVETLVAGINKVVKTISSHEARIAAKSGNITPSPIAAGVRQNLERAENLAEKALKHVPLEKALQEQDQHDQQTKAFEEKLPSRKFSPSA